MTRTVATIPALLGILAGGALPAPAMTHMSHAPTHAMPETPAKQDRCAVAVPLTEAAERQMGGALYDGPLTGVDGMAGAHEVHVGRHGGAFFMAPDRVHHIEARYSRDCGVQLFLYNALTKPISVNRFQAFVKLVPEDEKEWDREVIRFLSPRADGAVLQASGDHDIEGGFKIELYVAFPDGGDAELFNIPAEEIRPAGHRGAH